MNENKKKEKQFIFYFHWFHSMLQIKYEVLLEKLFCKIQINLDPLFAFKVYRKLSPCSGSFLFFNFLIATTLLFT